MSFFIHIFHIVTPATANPVYHTTSVSTAGSTTPSQSTLRKCNSFVPDDTPYVHYSPHMNTSS